MLQFIFPHLPAVESVYPAMGISMDGHMPLYSPYFGISTYIRSNLCIALHKSAYRISY